MRLWSIHPKYLDRQGLLGVWREGLLAQKVLLQGEYKQCPKCKGGEEKAMFLTNPPKEKICSKCKATGKIKTPYYNHPQLERFKNHDISIQAIIEYLWGICNEAYDRGYNFNGKKIRGIAWGKKLTVTSGQLEFEFNHLQKKLWIRDYIKAFENAKTLVRVENKEWNKSEIITDYEKIEPHPLFKVIEGEKESWEKGGE
jgi:hypothetical protein